MEAFPETLLGAARLQQDSNPVGIGIEIQRSASPIAQSDESVTFSVAYHLFMEPPLALSGLGIMIVESLTRKAKLMPDEYGCFEAMGEFSADYQTLQGLATFRDFELMGVWGTFVDCSFVLNAESDD